MANPRSIRLKIYYGTDNMAQIQVQAKKALGIHIPGKLPNTKTRKDNFQKLVKQNFAVYDIEKAFDAPQFEGPAKGSDAYIWLEKYALTDYGALMIARVLKNPTFKIRAMQGQAQANRLYISLPPQFPLRKTYPSGETIVPLAVIHHEFEHTVYGTQSNPHGSIKDERVAVRDMENPVRVLHNEEPRYTYFQRHSNRTVNIITGVVRTGQWRHDPSDPRKFIK